MILSHKTTTRLSLPETTRTGFTFAGWFTEQTGGDKVESGDKVTIKNNRTLYAHWTNQYTLKFNFSNGTVNSVVLDFNETTAYPDGIMKAMHTFDK